MPFMKRSSIILCIPVMGWVSCAAPKAIVVKESNKSSATTKTTAGEATMPTTGMTQIATDHSGLRSPDFLTMPDKREFESTNPEAKKSATPSSAVIARPPVNTPGAAKEP